MLNELFTTAVPAGSEYRKIGQISKEHEFLDAIVALMIRQVSAERPPLVAEIKGLIQRHRAEAVTLQRLGQLDGTVVPATAVDEPLALTPPKLIGFDWDHGRLSLTLDRAVTPEWIRALQQLGSYRSIRGKEPRAFEFRGDVASVRVDEHEVQLVIDCFKSWLPDATKNLKSQLEGARRKREQEVEQELRREREDAERRLRVLKNVRI